MNECPTCGRRIGGETCSYCEDHLAESDAADPSPVSGESLVAVFGCDGQQQADVVTSLLESEGIPAYQESAESIGEFEDSPVETSGDRIIMVGEEDADRAREIIKSAEHELEKRDD